MASVFHDDVEPITDRMHDNSWSANLEKPHHADDRTLVVEQAIDAIEHTVSGNHVNLVTHGDHGHPRVHLFDALGDEYGDDIEWHYVEQCGCGGPRHPRSRPIDGDGSTGDRFRSATVRPHLRVTQEPDWGAERCHNHLPPMTFGCDTVVVTTARGYRR